MDIKTKRSRAGGAARRSVVSAPSISPSLDKPSGLSGAKIDFQDGTRGTEQRLAWARYQQPWNTGGSAYAMTTGGFVSRERGKASAVATDFTTSNPTIATVIENLTTHNVGTGLTLSSKIDGKLIGITPKAARELASTIERHWARWSSSALECDLSGRHDLHELAMGGFETFLRTGELLAVLDVRRVPGAVTMTKVQLLDPNQLDVTKTRKDGALSTFQGVTFDANGRVRGYFILPLRVGHYQTAPQSIFVPAYTSWGRRKVVHLFPLRTPGQVRGLSPMTPALTSAQEKNTLGEFTLDAALLQTQYALTIESDLPSASALNGLRVDDGFATDGTSTIGPASLDARLAHYRGSPITAAPGVINHLSPGDKLKINRSDTPNSTYDSFDKSLTRAASKAAGSSYEDVSGDYSGVNFSASRMASETPHRINLKRRKIITENFYRAVYSAWLEEAIERGLIELPKGAPPFYAARDAYTQSTWLGLGRVQPDPLKAAQATKLELEIGLTTLSDALAERGRDFETTIEERKAEREMLKAAGLHNASTPDGENNPATNNTDDEADDVPRIPKQMKGKHR